MAIKIRKDGVVQDLVINANEVRVLDKDGNFRSKNLETVLKELNMNGGSGGGTGTGGSGYPKDAEYVYVKDTEPDMDGVWFDESDVSSQPIVGDNSVVKAIREYIDTDVKAIVDKNDKIVQDIKENVGDKLDVVSQLSGNNIIRNGSLDFWVNEQTTDCTDKNVEMAKYFHVVGEQSVVVDSAKDVEGLRVTFRNETSNTSNIRSYLDVDFVRSLIGKTLTFSAEYFSEWNDNWDDSVYCFIQDGAINTDIISTTTIELGNKWKRRIVTFRINNVPNEATEFHIQWFRGSNKNLFGYHLFKNFKLELGEKATNFEFKRPDQRIADTFPYNEVISNPNLLINGDFRNPINQRSQTSYNHGYTIDRWALWNLNTNLTINNGYCTLSGEYDIIVQHLENPPQYSNQTVTLSVRIRSNGGSSRTVLFSDEVGYIINQIIDDTNGEFVTVSVTGKIPNLTTQARLTVSIEGAGGSSVDIEWAKLELGSVATPFVPRLYAEELALCKRYYFRNRWKSLRCIEVIREYISTAEYNYPVQMRIAPTVRPLLAQPINQIATVDYTTNYYHPTNELEPTTIGIINEEMCCFRFTNKTIPTGKDYIVQIKDYAYEFDAEIYP